MIDAGIRDSGAVWMWWLFGILWFAAALFIC